MTDKWISGFEPWFLEAAADWAKSNGNLEGEGLSTYFQTKLRFIDYALYQRVSTKLAARTPSDSKVAVVEGDASIALSPIHFVYMDVGCWTGDGEPGWTKHREFGLVYGYVAVLCSFGDQPEYYKKLKFPTWLDFNRRTASTPLLNITIKKHPDFEPIKALLDNLAGASSLGNLRILGATMVTSGFVPVPARGAKDPITVFIGDFHAPVATNSGNAHVFDSGGERLLGRLDLSPAFPIEPDVRGVLAQVLRDMDFQTRTTRDAVEMWLRFYHQPGKKTADIFQGAGQDLRTFVDYLGGFHRSVWPLKVVQLGDLFDLWMGFQRAFKGSIDNLLPDAMDFARLWIERTLFKTEQSAHLTHLLTLSETAGRNRRTKANLETAFLYGNHDNYRKHGIGDTLTVPLGLEHAGKRLNVFDAPRKIKVPGMFAEHGHQPDSANCDEDPSFGHRITQAAFVEPGSRNLEGFLGWAIKLGDGNKVPRTLSIRHAMKRCLPGPKESSDLCRGIYVMGHSHEPMLKRVELWPFQPRKHR